MDDGFLWWISGEDHEILLDSEWQPKNGWHEITRELALRHCVLWNRLNLLEQKFGSNVLEEACKGSSSASE